VLSFLFGSPFLLWIVRYWQLLPLLPDSRLPLAPSRLLLLRERETYRRLQCWTLGLNISLFCLTIPHCLPYCSLYISSFLVYFRDVLFTARPLITPASHSHWSSSCARNSRYWFSDAMLKGKRSETDRTLIIIALVLVPIALLFSILFIALACSEYWSLHKGQASRLCCRRRAHKRSRSDPSWGSSSTKRSESSEGDTDMYQSPAWPREHV
jgi:hypothetical protein